MVHGYIVIIDPNILHMFRSGKSHLSQTSTENTDMFRRISSPKHLLKCPKLETGFLLLPPRPGPSLSVASTAAPLDRRIFAASTCPLCIARWSGVVPQALPPGAVGRRGFGGWAKRPTSRKRRKLWAAEFHRFNRLFRTQHLRNCSKQNIFTNKMNKVQYIFLANDIAFDETKCKNLSFKH